VKWFRIIIVFSFLGGKVLKQHQLDVLNVYASVAFAPGASVGVPITTGYGALRDKSAGYIDSISGWSGSVLLMAGFGGGIVFSVTGIIASEVNIGGSMGITASYGYTWYVGNVYE
jgi:fucose permease